MTDLYLKFSDSTTMLDVLRPLGMTYFAPQGPQIDPETDRTLIQDEATEGEERVIQGSHQFALWEVGEIPGTDGWHVNLRVIDPEFDVSSLGQFAVLPTSPLYVWA